jgi:hypothetical protein
MVPTAEAVAEAIATIPEGMPWAWAALRTMPAVRGERIAFIDDVEADRLGFAGIGDYPSLELLPGVDVTIGVDVDVVRVTISQAELDAWDMSLEQVLPVAMGNLRRAVGSWGGGTYDDEYEGVHVRMLAGWPMWASSLVLDAELLTRCFGSEDQLLVAPYTCNLISLPGEVDLDIAADLVDLFGTINPRALLIGLPAFALRHGALTTVPLPGIGDPDDDPGWA